MPPEELNCWSVDKIQSPSELHLLKLNLNNLHHENLSHLLYVFNVNRIESKDLDLTPINANLCDELMNRLHKSHLLLLFDFYKIKNKDKLDQLDNIQFFEADRLELYLNNLNILVGNTSIYVKNNCLYVTRPWNSNSFLDQLATKICELFGLSVMTFKKHIHSLLTTASIDAYFIQLGILPEKINASDDQLTDSIERDNLALVNRLKDLTPSYTPAQLLIAGLEAQNPQWTGYIYHYTHLENAVSILRDQSLKSRHLIQANNFKDSSAYDFMSQTHDQVNHYVRFYFRPRTLIQLNNENLGSELSRKRHNHSPICPVPIFFCIDLQAILNVPDLRWKVSLGDMSIGQTEYDCTLDVIKRFDFCNVFNNDFKTDREKRSAQLEFLIESQLDFRLLPNAAITLVYQNNDAKQSLECILNDQYTSIYKSTIGKEYYFGKNSQIFINHDPQQDYIHVMFDGKTGHTDGMFIVQIKSDHNKKRIDIACHGKICATFHNDYVTTVYGKQAPLKVFVGKQAYAVYYKYEDQLWLIYTNHNEPDFDRLHIEQHPEFMPYD